MTQNPHVQDDLQAIQKALSNYDMSFISEDEEDYCPLCLEKLDITDKNFKPCPCGYQICQFCYNNIRQNEELNGRCPACRRKYDDESVQYIILTPEEIKLEKEKQARKEWEKKQRDKERKENENANRKHLAGMRVIQKNLVYVVGVNPPVPYDEVVPYLKSDKYFGQYGKINKIVVNRRNPHSNDHHHHYGNTHTQGYGIYITYARKEDAAKCIAQVDGTYIDGRLVKAAYGTTKYCVSYLRGLPCQNPNCMFLHEPGEEADSFNRRELNNKQQHPNLTHINTTTTTTTTTAASIYNKNTSTTGTTTHSASPSPALDKSVLHQSTSASVLNSNTPRSTPITLHTNLNTNLTSVSTGHGYLDSNQNTGNSTPVLTPAPVPSGSNPWGVTQSSTPISSLNIAKNLSSNHNALPTLADALSQNNNTISQQQQSATTTNNNTTTQVEENKPISNNKKKNATIDNDYVDPYDTLNSAVEFLDSRINALSNYETHQLSFKPNVLDDSVYKKYPQLFSWDNVEISKNSKGTMTKKLVETLAFKPVDYSLSVIEFLKQNASVIAALNSNANSALAQQKQLQQQQQSQQQQQAHLQQLQQQHMQQMQQQQQQQMKNKLQQQSILQQHPQLNLNNPPPPGMFTPQNIPIQLQQQQQTSSENMPSNDFLNQLINGRRTAAAGN